MRVGNEYIVYGARELEAIASFANAVVSEWALAWVPSRDDVGRVTASLAASPGAEPMYIGDGGNDRWCALEVGPTLSAAIARLLFGNDSVAGSIVSRVAKEALEDLLRRMVDCQVSASCVRKAPLPTDGPGAKRVLLQIPLANTAAKVWLSSAMSARLAVGERRARAVATGCMPLKEAVYAVKVRIKVMLADSTVPLLDLATLRPGDVIELEQRLDDPCQLAVEGCSTTGLGFIGRVGEKRAVRVWRMHDNEDEGRRAG